jgi:hypothetical protein
MNLDDIVRMAREAGFEADESVRDVWVTDGYWVEELERFAALVIAAQRHPGYIMGDHWLQAAYTRICTGETEAEVMADYGWHRESR